MVVAPSSFTPSRQTNASPPHNRRAHHFGCISCFYGQLACNVKVKPVIQADTNCAVFSRKVHLLFQGYSVGTKSLRQVFCRPSGNLASRVRNSFWRAMAAIHSIASARTSYTCLRGIRSLSVCCEQRGVQERSRKGEGKVYPQRACEPKSIDGHRV